MPKPCSIFGPPAPIASGQNTGSLKTDRQFQSYPRELLTLTGHSDAIRFVAFSPDGQRIVTCSGDKTAKVWETASGQLLLTLTGHSETLASAAFSPDGQRIATACLDRTAKMWDTATGKELLTFRGHSY